MPGRHPDDDLLADLAADVLPPDEARALEAHVLSCDRCAGLLEDAERVRGLLLSADPGPVPADVWERIEATLAAEAAAGPGSGDRRNGGERADRTADTAAFQAFVDAPTAPGHVVALPSEPSSGSDEPEPGWAEDADPLDDPGRWSGPRAVRPARRGGGSTRRDARDPRERRRGPLLLAAAAAVGVVAVVGAVRLGGNNSSDAATMSAGGEGAASSPAGAGAVAPRTAAAPPTILHTGQEYTGKGLAQQAAALLKTSAGAGQQSEGLESSPAPAPSSASSDGRTVRGPQVKPNATADDITNPARLAGCLKALNVTHDTLVAVDLATYEGREAAVLLLVPAEGGGHEVWVVERTCAPGAEGALKYTRLTE